MAQMPRRTKKEKTVKKTSSKKTSTKNSENTENTNQQNVNQSIDKKEDANQPTSETNKKSTKSKKKKNEFDKSTNHLITDYYKVTRRKTTKTLKEEQDQIISYYIKNDIDDFDSLKIQEFENKGRGIVTLKRFEKGSFICEYRGDLIDVQKAKELEKTYESQHLGCYMYYFSWSNKQWCIDATADTGRLGRLINHSRKKPNLKTKLFILNEIPHLIFIALDDIEENTELLYDYGETNRCVIEAHPWIKNT